MVLFGKSTGVVLGFCELCPFTFVTSDFPKNPNRISISVGYGLRKSPCCHVNGALIAFEALILLFSKKPDYNSSTVNGFFDVINKPVGIFNKFFR